MLCSGVLGAQELPKLGKDPQIVSGSLPDGISYYLVNNAAEPGFADFALVQPSRTDRSGPRRNLVSLPHFFGRKPHEFLSDNAVGYGRHGFIEHSKDATIFRFAGVPVFQPEVTDSTLLMLFDIARSSAYEQAIIVSGNVDVSAVLERIRLLSMTISRRQEVADSWDYGWRQQNKAIVSTGTAPIGTINVIYRSPRTDVDLMNTIQPVMSRLLASELDVILQRRLRVAFEQAEIPLASYRYRYTGSESTPGDELFTISVHTSVDCLEKAVSTVAGVLSSLDEAGASIEETSFARTILAQEISRDYFNYVTTNAEYVSKCISSYLYGSNLAATSTLGKVLTNRKLDPGRECELLNRYVSAMLSPNRNLHLRVCAPVRPKEERMRELFAQGWEQEVMDKSVIPVAEDTLRLTLPRRKVKLKSVAKDSFTGGKLWTFSNGMTVVYKKTADKGIFHYGLMVKGGWPEISGIKGSEPSFAQDVFSLGKIAGFKSYYFRDLLAMYGITMEPSITISDVRVSGSALSESLSLVLKTMVYAMNGYESDGSAFSDYLKLRQVQLIRDKYEDSGTRAMLDSIMCPKYAFAAGSLPKLPADDFDLRIGQYMYQKSSNMKNAVIVLVGDLDEGIAVKLLCQTLGAFRTGQQRVVRSKIPFPLRQCWSTNVVQRNWRSTGVSVSLATTWPYGAKGYNQMMLACTMLKAELDKALMKDGMYSVVSGDIEMIPAERITLYIRCEPIAPLGLPADASTALPEQALNTVRYVLNGLATKEVSQEQLAFCKDLLTNRLKAEDGNSALLRDAVLTRGSLGQDVRGSYAQRIKTVTSSDIQELFSKLSGCTAEYVVQ